MKKLSAILPEWPEGMPENLVELMDHPYEHLDERGRALRSMAVDLVHSFERSPIHTPRDALELLEKHHLPARKGLWSIVALNDSKERVYVRSPGGMRLLHTVARKIPEPAMLAENVPLPQGGSYLAVYGGSPEGISEQDIEHLRGVSEEGVLSDVIFWDTSSGPAVFHSARAAVTHHGLGRTEKFENERLDLW